MPYLRFQRNRQETSSSKICTLCTLICRVRQETLECRECGMLQHRTCVNRQGSLIISREDYRKARKERGPNVYECQGCTDTKRSLDESSDKTTFFTKPSTRFYPLSPIIIIKYDLPLTYYQNNPSMEATNPVIFNKVPASFSHLACDRRKSPYECPDLPRFDRPAISDDVLIDIRNLYDCDIELEEGKVEKEDIYFHLIGERESGTRLIDSHGYSYTRGRTTQKGIKWKCAIRNKNKHCTAFVTQCGDQFIPGSMEHCHLAEINFTTKVI